MEEVDACDTLHLIHGVDIVSFGAIASLVFVDETDGTGLFSHAQHHFKEGFRHGHFVLADGFVLRFIQYRSTHDVDAAIPSGPFAAGVFQLAPVAAVQVVVLWTYIGEQERFQHGFLIPFIVGCGAQVSTIEP